jgi:two-component system nitrogen regulation response regulator NtrX
MAKILIIDDERGVCEELSEILRDEHHEVDSALNAVEGLEKLKANTYDLIFMDVLMPKMEGREALEQVKKICNTPVVIMSGYLPSHKEKEVIKAGALASLKKPLDLSQVFGLIERALELKKN